MGFCLSSNYYFINELKWNTKTTQKQMPVTFTSVTALIYAFFGDLVFRTN